MKIFLLFSILCLNVFAKDIPSVLPVVDQAGVLSIKDKEVLTNALVNIKNQTTNEISVVIIKALEDESIDTYSQKLFSSWKLGLKEKDNGILFLISIDDRKMRIEVGRGLEGDLPDITAGRIIRSIKPYFKAGDYRSGIFLAIKQIVKKTGGDLSKIPNVRRSRQNGDKSGIIFFIFFIIVMFMGRNNRGGGSGLTTALLIGSALSGRDSSGFSSGGGFGGGGGFSGGGASGDW